MRIKIADYFRQNYSHSVHRTSIQETEEVFVQQNNEESETAEVGKNGEDDPLLESTRTDEQAALEHQVSASQVSKRF